MSETTPPIDQPPPPDAAPSIVLTGFMGTGKSTVARLLAERTGRRAVDTDELIEARHGPIPELFARHGEAHFRTLERAVAHELGGVRGLVVSTGGGMLLDRDNVSALNTQGRIFCLTATIDELLQRLRADGSTERPLLAGPDPRSSIGELLRARADAYASFEQVDTTGRTPAQVVDELIARLVDAG